MSCPYYYWNNHFACRKANKDVNEDTYYKYCRNYDYGDCPIYKGQTPSDSGGCYLTSACVAAKGLPDDCYELQTLRHFRDTYLRSKENGASDIEHYYRVAPRIVYEISSQDNPQEIFSELYENLVRPCVTLIEQTKLEDAYLLYKRIAVELEQKYLATI